MHDMVTVNTWQYSTSVYGRSRALATLWFQRKIITQLPSKLFQSSIMWNTVVKARCQFFAKEVKRIQYDQPRVMKLL